MFTYIYKYISVFIFIHRYIITPMSWFFGGTVWKIVFLFLGAAGFTLMISQPSWVLSGFKGSTGCLITQPCNMIQWSKTNLYLCNIYHIYIYFTHLRIIYVDMSMQHVTLYNCFYIINIYIFLVWNLKYVSLHLDTDIHIYIDLSNIHIWLQNMSMVAPLIFQAMVHVITPLEAANVEILRGGNWPPKGQSNNYWCYMIWFSPSKKRCVLLGPGLYS